MAKPQTPEARQKHIFRLITALALANLEASARQQHYSPQLEISAHVTQISFYIFGHDEKREIDWSDNKGFPLHNAPNRKGYGIEQLTDSSYYKDLVKHLLRAIETVNNL